MATKAGEIELDVRLTGDDISKTLHKISDSITKKFDSAFSSLSKDFENVSTDMKQSFSKVSEGVSQKTEKEFSNIKGSGEQLSNSVSSSFKKIGMAVVAAFSVAKIKEFGQQCIESAAEVNAANSQFEQTFGTMQSQAESAIQSVANQSGILETRLQGVGTSIYAFAKTTGMDSSSALGMRRLISCMASHLWICRNRRNSSRFCKWSRTPISFRVLWDRQAVKQTVGRM